MRGKAVGLPENWNTAGITPACAGKSSPLIFITLVNWDHPRVCGEKHNIENLGGAEIGSPPRVRGKEKMFQ